MPSVQLFNHDNTPKMRGSMDMVDGTQEEPILAWVKHEVWTYTKVVIGEEFEIRRGIGGWPGWDIYRLEDGKKARHIGTSQLMYSWDDRETFGRIKVYFK